MDGKFTFLELRELYIKAAVHIGKSNKDFNYGDHRVDREISKRINKARNPFNPNIAKRKAKIKQVDRFSHVIDNVGLEYDD